MNKDIADYAGALKFAFSKAYGGETADWTIGAESAAEDGKALTEFRNAKSGVTLQVSGGLEADFAKFSAKRVDAAAGPDDAINMSIPSAWKGLSL